MVPGTMALGTTGAGDRQARRLSRTTKGRRNVCDLFCADLALVWRDAPSTFADPEVAMRKIREIAITPEAIQDGRIHIEKINGPLLFE
jgi:hypothetical protein